MNHNLHYSHHEGISCDHCMKSNFRGKRYKCLVCQDYDLCSSCYESGTVPSGKRHTSEHPVQCILTRNDYEIYFGGEPTPVEQIQSFTCPICGKMGFTENLLYEHSVQEHSETFTEVTCPICCSMQTVEPGLIIEDFTSHLSIEHRSGRNYDAPQTVRGRRVPHPNRSVNQSRNRRQMTPTTVTMLSNINPLLNSLPHDQSSGSLAASQLRDLDPITELLSQIRRSHNQAAALSSNSFNSNSNPLHLHLDRNNFRGSALRQAFERPAADILVRRHNQNAMSNQNATSNQSNSNHSNAIASGLSYLLDASNNNNLLASSGQTVPNSNNLSNQGNNQPSSNQFQFLLSTCKEKPKITKELEDAQKVDKSLFIQELLISSIENFFKHDLKFEKSRSDKKKLSMEEDQKKNGDEIKEKSREEDKLKETDNEAATNDKQCEERRNEMASANNLVNNQVMNNESQNKVDKESSVNDGSNNNGGNGNSNMNDQNNHQCNNSESNKQSSNEQEIKNHLSNDSQETTNNRTDKSTQNKGTANSISESNNSIEPSSSNQLTNNGFVAASNAVNESSAPTTVKTVKTNGE